MDFHELIINLSNPELIDTISEWLEEHGAAAVTLQDAADEPILEPELQTTPVWQQTQLTALFHDAALFEMTLTNFKQQFPTLDFATKKIKEQNWLQQSVADFKPVCFADTLWIHPSWELPPQDAKVTLQLDPGLAFGTGTHPTTAMCLTWLAKQDLTDKTIIDYGCGSGILALAALKLGAKKVWAVDIDPQALDACKNNAALNHIDKTSLSVVFPQDLPAIKTDILIANILAQPLIELAAEFMQFLNPAGKILLTGILNRQESPILEIYQSYCDIEVIDRTNEWSLLFGILRAKT